MQRHRRILYAFAQNVLVKRLYQWRSVFVIHCPKCPYHPPESAELDSSRQAERLVRCLRLACGTVASSEKCELGVWKSLLHNVVQGEFTVVQLEVGREPLPWVRAGSVAGEVQQWMSRKSGEYGLRVGIRILEYRRLLSEKVFQGLKFLVDL